MRNYSRSTARFKGAYLCVFLTLVAGLSMSGCVLAPFISSFQELGATSSGREQLLTTDLKRYTEALFWGNSAGALRLVDDKMKDSLAEEVRSYSATRRMVESKIIDVAFNDSSYHAEVTMRLRYYEVPVYIVKDYTEQQKWEFSFTDGWKLTGRSAS